MTWDKEDEKEFIRRLELASRRAGGLHDDEILTLADFVSAGDIDIDDDGRLVVLSDQAKLIFEVAEVMDRLEKGKPIL